MKLANDLEDLVKKIEYIEFIPLMIVAGFPEWPDSSKNYSDFQYLNIQFDEKDLVKKIVYENPDNAFLSYLDKDGKITKCSVRLTPDLVWSGWKKCSEVEAIKKF